MNETAALLVDQVLSPAPADDEIRKLVETIARRVIRLLVRRGVLDETSEAPDQLVEQEPVLAGLMRASVMDTAITGERAGRRIRRVLSDPEPGHQTTARQQPPTTHILLTASELLTRLAALVPPRGVNGTRYHGVLAPRSSVRELIIPAPPEPDQPSVGEGTAHEPPATVSSRRRRIPWAELLRRVFRVDIEQCHCGGRCASYGLT